MTKKRVVYWKDGKSYNYFANSKEIKNMEKAVESGKYKSESEYWRKHVEDKEMGKHKVESDKTKDEFSIKKADETKDEFISPNIETNVDTFDLNNWREIRDKVCATCKDEPQKKENGEYYVYCYRIRYIGGKPKGLKGEIRVEECLSTQSYFLSKMNKEIDGRDKEMNRLKDLVGTLTNDNYILNAKLKEYQKEEYDKTADNIQSILKGQKIFCRIKNMIIPLWRCIDIQEEQSKMPKHFIAPNSKRCPCDKFMELKIKGIIDNIMPLLPWLKALDMAYEGKSFMEIVEQCITKKYIIETQKDVKKE